MGGYHLVYSLYKTAIRQEMNSYLSVHPDSEYGSNFIFLAQDGNIKDPSFVWKENGKEFTYQGDWYDVVSLKKKGDSLQICCIKDGKENNLEKQFSRIHQTTNSGTTGKMVSMIKIFSLFYFPDNNKETAIAFQRQITYLKTINESLLNADSRVISPPPRC